MKTWKKYLRSHYRDFDEWHRYSQTYGLAARLGYSSEKSGLDGQPVDSGQHAPQDFPRATDRSLLAAAWHLGVLG